MNENTPEPQVDEDPDEGNSAGGVDAPDVEAPFPPVTPDEPLSAQVAEEAIPDEIQESEEPDQDDETVSGESETPAEPSA